MTERKVELDVANKIGKSFASIVNYSTKSTTYSALSVQKKTSFNLESKLNLMQKLKDLESNEILLPN